MQVLCTPWRREYILAARQPEGCVFCGLLAAPASDAERLILHRGDQAYLLLNRYPYTPGHLLVVPYEHTARLAELPVATLDEMLALSQVGEHLIRSCFGCRSLHGGANVGRVAGAGVPDHIHFHLVAWPAGQLWTECCSEQGLPEGLPETYARMQARLPALLQRT